MPKTVKPYTTRKRPVPSDSHADIDEWSGSVMPQLQPIIAQLDESIRKALSGLHYAVKWKRAFYGTPELGWIIEIVAYDVSVNVVFLGGADFDDPPPLGESDRSRYAKVTSVAEAQEPDMRRWIDQAGRVPGWK